MEKYNERYFHISRETIKNEIDRNTPIVDMLLSDISNQSAENLVNGLSREQEEVYTSKHYFGAGKLRLYN